jgi:hypothetical protein
MSIFALRGPRSSFAVTALLCASLASCLTGCHKTGTAPSPVTGTSVTAVYTIPASLDELSQQTFFDQPWPNDLRLENGSPRFTGYYNPNNILILETYLQAITGLLDGFSPAGAGYLRFTGDIDPSTLPATPKDGLDPAASVQLIDIEPTSPQHGQRMLVSLEWRAPAGVYYMPDTLAYMPAVGFPLRTHNRYALVVTSALKDTKGGAVAQSETVAELVGAATPSAANTSASTTFASAVTEIESAGVTRADIVHLAVFTTADPTAELIEVRDGVAKTIAAPTADPTQWAVGSTLNGVVEYTGNYGPSPNYQVGTIPFINFGDGGQFSFQNGLPVLQSMQTLRFSLMIPDPSACPMPAAGYPIVMYAHGTGGDYESYVQDGTGYAMAAHCLATMGVDQIFQGTRPGSMPGSTEAEIGLVFYNFNNPVAARTNGRQSAIDEVQRARLFTESHLSVPASISASQSEILLDSTKIEFFGHSQGGLNGPLFTAIDPSSRGGVFSGSGAEIVIALLLKTDPQPSVAGLVSSLLLGLNASNSSELDIFHPGMSLIQSLTDVVDPLHYARLQATEPRPGFAPKSVYMTEGINPDGTGDTYAPPPGIEAHALAIGLPLQIPFEHAITQLAWGGAQPVMVPAGGLSGDLAGGATSGILAQWAVPTGDDGHFVVFDVPSAQMQAAQFNENLAASPKGNVPPPGPQWQPCTSNAQCSSWDVCYEGICEP